MSATNPVIGTPAQSDGNPPGRAEKAFVARQPIYRDDVKVFAYELLFRNNELNQASFTNADQATAQVLLDTFMEIGLDRVVGPNLAFVQVTRNFLLSDYCSLLPKDRLVLQLPEDIIPDAPLLDAISRLWKEGYLIALDNFRYSEWLRPLLAVADIVKLDVQALDREAIGKQIELLRQFEVKLLAKNVETHEDYEYYKTLGFDYYQGFFFCKPQTIGENKIPANRMAALRLLSKLQDPKLTTDELEETVAQDVALSYKLIRYVNSALHALPKEVASIRHAIILVGTRRISNWAGLILYGQMDDKPGELMITAIIRARMCQQLAVATSQKNADQFFTVGLFSVLDALLDRPMANALEQLPIAQELKTALVDHQGPMGSALQCVMAYEMGDWDQAQYGAVAPEAIYDSYVNALEWTRRTMKELGLEPALGPQESIRRRSEVKLKLQKFADDQEQKIKQAEEEARKRVTRDLLARFDLEFQRLSLEFEEKHQHAIAATQSAAEMRLKEALAEAEHAREDLQREFESAAQHWEVERQQLRQEERTANQAVQVEREEWAGLETNLSETKHGQPVRSERGDVSGSVTAEILRIEPVIEEISRKIECDYTDLSTQIRLNRERSDLEAYLRGLRYSLGEVAVDN